MPGEVVNNIFFTLLGIAGAVLTAIITSRGEKPTATFEAALREERNQVAQKEKMIIELRAEILDWKKRVSYKSAEYEAAMAWANKLYRIARKYKPSDLELPDYEPPNGNTPSIGTKK